MRFDLSNPIIDVVLTELWTSASTLSDAMVLTVFLGGGSFIISKGKGV